MTLSDTSTWLPLDGLAPGFDANKAPLTGDIDGRAFVLRDDAGGPGFTWDGTEAETFLVDDGLYYVQPHPGAAREAVSLILDVRDGRALVVTTRIGDAGTPRVTQEFRPATIDGAEVRGAAMAPSTALIGRRVVWVYSEDHAYEHVYLSPHWYTWQCLAGPERGLADTDENSVYQIRPGIHVFAWREKVISCASVTIADHRNARALRSHGVLFGLDHTGEDTTCFTFGAHGRLLSTTVHPAGLDPAEH
ncbi:molybdenum cofactor biosynthesis F family protein [Amycolatopsis sp. NBC_01307]|uniref:MoaF C-terminal domain-containing protein n=1 Tax=Amycolatopsis sp. NBC_01307 TaxID=2903561 RepID=UPI002E10EA02|nr:molybdenum cofactor biosynthesis F family protein [Amycolatopsis sp. NBC_01307]